LKTSNRATDQNENSKPEYDKDEEIQEICVKATQQLNNFLFHKAPSMYRKLERMKEFYCECGREPYRLTTKFEGTKVDIWWCEECEMADRVVPDHRYFDYDSKVIALTLIAKMLKGEYEVGDIDD
jgi:hypothetical protein